MYKVGLTGSIGSGKTTIGKIFTILGIPVYFADIEAKKILDQPEIVQLIAEKMGPDVLTNLGLVDRKALASRVFKNTDALQWLNSIIHPRVRKDFIAWVERNSHLPYIIQESAIMLETGFSTYFDKVIVVSCPLEERIDRVVKRDNMTRKEMMERMDNQWSEELKLAKADLVISNDEMSLALPQTIDYHNYLLKLAENKRRKYG